MEYRTDSLWRAWPGVALAAARLTLAALAADPSDPPPAEPATTPEGFRLAAPGYDFQFPRDHGSHPDFKLEWWYLTGHFGDDQEEPRYGFQATFFRVGRTPGAARPPEANPAFGTHQWYLAHMALVDGQRQRFVHEERFQRENWDAWAAVGDLEVRNGNWSLQRDQASEAGESLRLRGSVLATARWDLRLTPTKPRVIFGKEGVSRKGANPSAASLYITFPRLALQGTLDYEGRRVEVRGEAWMDHEISSSQLDEQQTGWDWASIQLEDGREIMLYLLRLDHGRFDPHSRLYWIDRASRLTEITPDAFRWEPRDFWQSEVTGTRYPTSFDLTVTDPENGQPVTFRLSPVIPQQEMVGRLSGIHYWEGACRVIGTSGKTLGRAYVELTGYDGRLAPWLR